MKIYNVVETDHYNGNAPQEYNTYCKTFTDKSEAEEYKKELENKYEMRWCGPHNHVTIFASNITIPKKKKKIDYIWDSKNRDYMPTRILKENDYERIKENWNVIYFIDPGKKVKYPF